MSRAVPNALLLRIRRVELTGAQQVGKIARMWDAAAGIYLLATMLGAGFVSWRAVGDLARGGLLCRDWQVRLLATAAIMGCLMVGVVEVVSLFKGISALGLGTGWLFAAAIVAVVRSKFTLAEEDYLEALASPRGASLVTPEGRLLLFLSGLIISVLFLLAVLTPPTSWDSLTYHLPRVLNWIQNESVAHYATHDSRQVESGPFASFAVMQLYLVTDSDRLVNLVQWSAMLLSVIGVSWLAAKLVTQSRGADEAPAAADNSAAWASFFAVTMPIGIVQSITTQTDYVVALWVTATAVFGYLFWKEPANRIYAALLGASMAMGTITKATMVVTAGLLSACIIVGAIRNARSNPVRLRGLLIIAISGVLIVVPHFTRNTNVFGSPLGSNYIYLLMRNDYQSPSIWVSNFLRNLSLHAATGIPALTTGINTVLREAHKLSGREENARDSTFYTSTFSYAQGYPVSDNSAGNFWHALIALCGSLYLAVRFRSLRRWAGFIIGIILITFIVQSGYLRWTEWNARFHLPLFLILCPIAGISLARLPGVPRVICGVILTIVGLHATLYNKSRPVLGGGDFLFLDRERQYFLEVPHIYMPAVNAMTDIVASGSKNVGLRMYKNFFAYMDEMEYPFWAMLRNRDFRGRIVNIGVTNETARLSNSVPIGALISSAKGPREEVAHVLPYMLKYPPIDVYWAESSSGWIQLAQIGGDGTERPLVENPDALEMADNAAVLACRSARQGVLAVEAVVIRGEAPVEGPTTLLIKTFAGFATVSQSTNARHSFEIPLPAGITAVQVGIPGAAPGLNLPLKWEWRVIDDPLPYVYISRIYDPARTEGSTTNALDIPPGGSRAIQLVSGSAGTVELRFFSRTSDRAELDLRIGGAHSQVILTNGVGIAQFAIQRGTNQCVISNSTPVTAALERIDPTFRAMAAEN